MFLYGTKYHYAGVAQLVEHFVANEDVRGSNPLTRSNNNMERL